MRSALLACAACALLLALGAAGAPAAGPSDVPGGEAAPRLALPAPAPGPADAGLTKPGDEIPAWKARWELARLLSYTKKLDQAEAQYRRLLKEKPKLWQARAELARVLSWAGKNRQAMAELDKLPPAQAGPDSMLLKADLLATAKDYAGSAALYRGYLKQRPEDLAARFRLAQVLSWAKDYPASLEQYRLILDKRPQDAQVRRHYAFVLSWAGRFEEAARQLAMTLKD